MRLNSILSVALSLTLSLSVVSKAFGSTSAQGDQKEWTFLIYLNGNNSLDSYGPVNLMQMEKVGSTDKVNVVVQWASESAGKTVRLLVQKSSDPSQVTSPIIQDMGKVDMGDYNSLIDFVKWGVAKYPAQHYFIDVWDHGSGWHGLQTFGSGGIKPLDISWDDTTGHYFTSIQLGQAIAESAKIIGHKVDLYASDACLMGMVELADQVASSVQIYAGSEEVEPGPGWPYDTLLQKWNALDSASPADVAKILTHEYVASYEGGENGTQDATFAAYDLSKISAMDQAIADFGTDVMKLDAGSRKQLVSAIGSSQAFFTPDYVDFGDFLDHVKSANIVRGSTIDNAKTALSSFVIAAEATDKYTASHGMAIWLPNTSDTYSQYSSSYETLDFEGHTKWSEVLHYALQDSVHP